MEHRELRQCPPDRPPGRLRRRCTERRSRRRWQGRHLRERPETSGWRAWREPLGDPRLAQLRDLVTGEDLEMSRKKKDVSSVNVHRWRLSLERKNMQRFFGSPRVLFLPSWRYGPGPKCMSLFLETGPKPLRARFPCKFKLLSVIVCFHDL